jgi:hypothetical protein
MRRAARGRAGVTKCAGKRATRVRAPFRSAVTIFRHSGGQPMPLRVGLTYTQMKLGRAYEHLDQLKREVDVFI